jgi:hypothetical protein
MSTNKRRGRWPWIVGALIGLYVASFGPAVWVAARGSVHEMIVKCAYWPFLCQRVHLPNSLGAAIHWYGSLGVPNGKVVVFTIDDLEGDTISASFGGNVGP